MGRAVDEFKFYHTSEAAGKEAFPELTKTPTVVVLRDFDEPKLFYTEEIKSEPIEAFLRKNQLPTVANFDQETVTVVFQRGSRKGVVLVYRPGTDDKAKEEFTKFAQANKSPEYLFIAASSRDEWGQRLVNFYGMSDTDMPVVEGLTVKNGEPQRFRHKGEIVLDQLNAFFVDLKAGKIAKFVKSEEIPATNPGPVYTVVGKSFKADVIDNDMDVLVKFYAPWCGHCKHLAPIYVQTAEALKHNPKLRLVEIDATKNDIEGVNVRSFPTIKFYKAGQKDKPIDFSGDRTQEGFTKFLKEKCTNPVADKKADL